MRKKETKYTLIVHECVTLTHKIKKKTATQYSVREIMNKYHRMIFSSVILISKISEQKNKK